jgi:hypothetical protein
MLSDALTCRDFRSVSFEVQASEFTYAGLWHCIAAVARKPSYVVSDATLFSKRRMCTQKEAVRITVHEHRMFEGFELTML